MEHRGSPCLVMSSKMMDAVSRACVAKELGVRVEGRDYGHVTVNPEAIKDPSLYGLRIYEENGPSIMQQKTGRVIWPDGSISRDIPDKYQGRFVEYEQSDIEWIVGLADAEYEMEEICYEIYTGDTINMDIKHDFDEIFSNHEIYGKSSCSLYRASRCFINDVEFPTFNSIFMNGCA